MLRLHLSLAAARSAAGNDSIPAGTAENLPRTPDDLPPARVSPDSDRLSTNGGSQPKLQRGSQSAERAGKWSECLRNGGEGLIPGAKSEAGGMVKKEQSPATSRRNCAVAAETQADESDHSGYDTAAGYSDVYESFGECAESPPSNDNAGDLRPSLRAQVGREEPALSSERVGSSTSSVLLWDRSPCGGDEAHYITTHEIQLFELDNDGESELDAGWEAEESSACYSCRDSSSLESDASEGNSRTPLGISYAGDPPQAVCTTINPLENLAENGNSGGQLQLSIRAVSEGSGAQEARNPPTANSQGSGNQEDLTKLQSAGDVCKDANSRRNIPPSAVAKCNWKAFGNSSGTSSAVSELDDADKEVRSLTARTFRSLACAGDEYLDTFSVGCRTSTDLSADETVALNRCATYIDLKCRNTTGGRGQVGFPTKSGKSGAGQGAESTQKRQELPVDKQTAKRQLHLSGKFEQSGSRVITLTETLNFRYDIREQISARREGERRAQLARGAVGSRCADEVTEPREEGGENSREIGRTAEAMDGVQKKSKFASNLLQNVIWKKMQFEQELKMERGEISDTTFAAAPTSPPAAATDSPKGRDVLEPNCNRLSGGSPETCPLPGEAVPCQTLPVSSSARSAASGEPPCDGCKGTLPRSQRSAFRSWKDNEPPQTGSKRAQRVRAEIGGHPLCKETKMSQLFVPGIQKAPGKKKNAQEEKEEGDRASSKPSDRTATTQGNRAASKPGVPATSSSPEIQIRLQGGLPSPFSIAKLLTPDIIGGGGPGREAAGDAGARSWTGAGEEAGGRARAPPFAVRDVRDNLQRLQAPIHQVRDVRKLVKSSYHVLTTVGPGGGGKGAGGGSVQPIVIKCQAVSRKEARPGPGSEEERASGLAQRASGRSPARVPGNEAEQRGNRLALEKLTAAVKTMEQLYVFDNHEWRRRSDASAAATTTATTTTTAAAALSGPGLGLGPLAGSRLLSLIASEEASGGSARVPGGGDGRQLQEEGEERAVPAREGARAGVGARLPPPGPAHVHAPTLLPPPPASRRAVPGPAHKPPAGASAGGAAPPLFAVAPQPSATAIRTTPAAGGGRRSPQQPPPPPPDLRPFRIQTAERNEKQAAAAGWQQKSPPVPAPPPSEHENYLTIPVKKLPPAAPRDPTPPVVYQHQQAQLIRLTPPAPDPFSPGKVQPVPPVMVDSPSMPFFPVPQTQRRMLLDPATGQYYLVDTPVQPARRRLYDPETGQYVDVPMPQQPVAPMPVPMSPISFNPGTYGHTYMIYPGFMPPPTMLPTLPPAPDPEYSDSGKGSIIARQHPEPQYLESSYYFPTGTVGQTTPSRVDKGLSEGKPIVSITSQQGPRIIAPPSFDGTTMSFVVEHR
ncbi:uncharacterized protein C4orf54 homolog [Amblyraja radiata]|uniref:uncharacterized protein C4orf54 homolog n=1 Tax=Amblyraja radiata TaxID=386614 RepID=UPI00140226D5|nr:uncharacterized protein C4orf54 homolog [Amblyraja radiata]